IMNSPTPLTRPRKASVKRETNETQIQLELDLDGSGQIDLHSGVGFLDHMLAQLALHDLFDLSLTARGDLDVDCHHTVEDLSLALGEAFYQALGDRRGICLLYTSPSPRD